MCARTSPESLLGDGLLVGPHEGGGGGIADIDLSADGVGVLCVFDERQELAVVGLHE